VQIVFRAEQNIIVITLALSTHTSYVLQGITVLEATLFRRKTAQEGTIALRDQLHQGLAPMGHIKMSMDGTTAKYVQQGFTALGHQALLYAQWVAFVLLELELWGLLSVVWVFSIT